MTSTDRLRTVGSRSLSPTKPTLAALACNAVQWRDLSACEVNIARPKSMSLSDSPIASSVPPLTPTNALIFDPPTVNTSTLTSSAVFLPLALASVTVLLLVSIARSPSIWINPNKSIFRWPVA